MVFRPPLGGGDGPILSITKGDSPRTVQDLLDKIGLLPTEPSDIPGVPPAELVGFVVRWNRGLRQWKKSSLADFASVSVSTVERVERGEKVSEEVSLS
jgi:hypothetical protein